MSDDPTAPKGGLEYQVGMLAGQVNSILTSINLWQQGNTPFISKIKTLTRQK